jgi:hypothetical protein
VELLNLPQNLPAKTREGAASGLVSQNGQVLGKPLGYRVVVTTGCICYLDRRSDSVKKLVLCFVLLPLFFSCDANNWNDTIIKNNSEFAVKFKFSNTAQINLPAGRQASFPTKAYQHLESYTPEKRVYFTYSATNDGYTGVFDVHDSWEVKVQNAIGEKATLSADGWMDDIVDIVDNSRTGKVYTNNPQFIVTKTESNFLAVAVYNRDTEGNFYVTIQWSR